MYLRKDFDKMILSCSHITKAFGDHTVVSDATFHIEEHEKAAIIGINGAGKSTLLKIIVGELESDSGNVAISSGKTLGYLAQQQNLSTHKTIYDEVVGTRQDILQMEADIREMEEQMNHLSGNELETLLTKYTNLTHQFELINGYSYRSEVVGVLKGLGFMEDDFTLKVDTLSGGQKTRVALSKLLLSSPDIILLDEPTNHLDMESITWLENYLASYNGSVIIVAHDRYFLDKIVTKIIEIDCSKVTCFSGNYTDYAAKKAVLRNMQLKEYLNQQQNIKHQEEVIAKLKQFNREKSIKRAESREKMLNKIERVEKPIEVNNKMNIQLEPEVLSGNDVLSVKNLSKSFDDNILFDDISFEIKRGERVALIGNNGTGKTTLLKIINNLIPANSGEIQLGAKVAIGYYDQEHHVLDLEKTLFEEIQDAYPDLNHTKIRNTLAAFLFTGSDVFRYIHELSGGERGRLSLAKLMLSNANFLILDEPTNHLDMVSKEILEEALNNYTGTVFYVSHDRYFINTTATRIIELTNKSIINYIGNYDYYLNKRDILTNKAFGNHTKNINSKIENVSAIKLNHSNEFKNFEESKNSKELWQQSKEEQAKLKKIKNQLKNVEEKINQLEERIKNIDKEYIQPEISSNTEKLTKLHNEKVDLSKQLDTLYEQWEELSSIHDGFC